MRIATLLALSLAAAVGISSPKPVCAQASPATVIPAENAIALQVSTGTYMQAADGKDEWTEAKSFQAGSPVWATVAIANLTDHVAYLHLRGELPPFGITLKDGNGLVPEFTEIGCRMHFCAQATSNSGQLSAIVLSGMGATWTLNPRETIVKYVDVSREFQLSKPGSYQMSLLRTNFVISGATKKEEVFSGKSGGRTEVGPVRSNTVEFQILP